MKFSRTFSKILQRNGTKQCYRLTSRLIYLLLLISFSQKRDPPPRNFYRQWIKGTIRNTDARPRNTIFHRTRTRSSMIHLTIKRVNKHSPKRIGQRRRKVAFTDRPRRVSSINSNESWNVRVPWKLLCFTTRHSCLVSMRTHERLCDRSLTRARTIALFAHRNRRVSARNRVDVLHRARAAFNVKR